MGASKGSVYRRKRRRRGHLPFSVSRGRKRTGVSGKHAEKGVMSQRRKYEKRQGQNWVDISACGKKNLAFLN